MARRKRSKSEILKSIAAARKKKKEREERKKRVKATKTVLKAIEKRTAKERKSGKSSKRSTSVSTPKKTPRKYSREELTQGNYIDRDGNVYKVTYPKQSRLKKTYSKEELTQGNYVDRSGNVHRIEYKRQTVLGSIGIKRKGRSEGRTKSDLNKPPKPKKGKLKRADEILGKGRKAVTKGAYDLYTFVKKDPKGAAASLGKGVAEVAKEVLVDIPVAVGTGVESYRSSLARRAGFRRNDIESFKKIKVQRALAGLVASDIKKLATGTVAVSTFIRTKPKNTAFIISYYAAKSGRKISSAYKKDPVKTLTKAAIYLAPSSVVVKPLQVAGRAAKGIKLTETKAVLAARLKPITPVLNKQQVRGLNTRINTLSKVTNVTKREASLKKYLITIAEKQKIKIYKKGGGTRRLSSLSNSRLINEIKKGGFAYKGKVVVQAPKKGGSLSKAITSAKRKYSAAKSGKILDRLKKSTAGLRPFLNANQKRKLDKVLRDISKIKNTKQRGIEFRRFMKDANTFKKLLKARQAIKSGGPAIDPSRLTLAALKKKTPKTLKNLYSNKKAQVQINKVIQKESTRLRSKIKKPAQLKGKSAKQLKGFKVSHLATAKQYTSLLSLAAKLGVPATKVKNLRKQLEEVKKISKRIDEAIRVQAREQKKKKVTATRTQTRTKTRKRVTGKTTRTKSKKKIRTPKKPVRKTIKKIPPKIPKSPGKPKKKSTTKPTQITIKKQGQSTKKITSITKAREQARKFIKNNPKKQVIITSNKKITVKNKRKGLKYKLSPSKTKLTISRKKK